MRLSLPITDRIQDARWPWCAPFWTAYYVRCYVRDKKQGPASLQALDLYGAGTRSRTRDLLITRKMLSTYISVGYRFFCYVLMP